jgi:hypothetical protein
MIFLKIQITHPGNTKGGSITVPLTSCLTDLDQSVLQIKTNIVSSHTADSKLVTQEVNGTVIPDTSQRYVLEFYFISIRFKISLHNPSQAQLSQHFLLTFVNSFPICINCK